MRLATWGRRRRNWVEVEWVITNWTVGLSFWLRERAPVRDYEVSLHVGPVVFSLRINRPKALSEQMVG